MKDINFTDIFHNTNESTIICLCEGTNDQNQKAFGVGININGESKFFELKNEDEAFQMFQILKQIKGGAK